MSIQVHNVMTVDYHGDLVGFAFRRCLQLSNGGIAWSIVDTTQCTTLAFVKLNAKVSLNTYNTIQVKGKKLK